MRTRGTKGWTGRDQARESWRFCDSRGRVGHTDASFVQLTHAWGMGAVGCLERFPHENREGRQAARSQTKGAFNGAASLRILLLDTKELWCDGEKATGPLLPSGGVGWLGLGRWGASTAGAGRSSEVSPPHSVTNPSGVSTLHTPSTSLSFRHLGQLSEDPPNPGATTGKDGDFESASHGFSPHHFTLTSLPSVSFLSRFFFFFQLQGSSAHFVSTGLLPGSHPDIRHMSACPPSPRPRRPGARRRLGLNPEEHCCPGPTRRRILSSPV